jgi:hypothetical protein
MALGTAALVSCTLEPAAVAQSEAESQKPPRDVAAGSVTRSVTGE